MGVMCNWHYQIISVEAQNYWKRYTHVDANRPMVRSLVRRHKHSHHAMPFTLHKSEACDDGLFQVLPPIPHVLGLQ